MTLPVTISGIVATIPIAGPFYRSNGVGYFIGVSSADATKIRAYKATDPTSSWSNVGTDPAVTNAVTVDWVSAWQEGDTLHVGTASTPSTATNSDYYYKTFDMSSDAWSATNEAIATGIAVNAAAGTKRGVSICRRTSSGEMFVLLQATYLYMSVLYAATQYVRRTGGSWTSPPTVLTSDNLEKFGPRVIADPNNDRVYIAFSVTANSIYEFAFSAANAMSGRINDTNQATPVNPPGVPSLTNWNDAGTTRVVMGDMTSTAGSFRASRWAGGDTISKTSVAVASTAGRPVRLFHDGANTGTSDVWALYRNTSDSDLYVKKSADDGATWGSATNVMTASIAADAALSIDADRTGVIQRGDKIVIPFFVNDNSTLKYNEYTVRFVTADLTATDLRPTTSPLFGTPTLTISGYVFTANDLVTGAPVLGAPTLASTAALTAAGLVAGSPVFGTPTASLIFALPSASDLVTGSPTFGTPTVASKAALTASDLRPTTSPLFGAPTVASTAALSATGLVPSSPLLGEPAFAGVVAMTASGLIVSSPSLGEPTATSTASLTATGLVPSGPALGQPTMVSQANLTAVDLVSSSPQFGTPTAAVVIPLAANDLISGGPILDTPTLASTAALGADALSTGPPLFGQPTLASQASLTANALVPSSPLFGEPDLQSEATLTATGLILSSPIFGTPTVSVVGAFEDLILSFDVLDFGLTELLDVDQIFICSDDPESFSDLATVGLGLKDFGAPSLAFSGPADGVAGRKVTATEIVDGSATSAGTVTRWAAVDSATSRLLARGGVAEPFVIGETDGFSLSSYDIREDTA